MLLRIFILLLSLTTSISFADGVADARDGSGEYSVRNAPVSFKDLRVCYIHAHHMFEKPLQELKFIFLDDPEAQEYLKTKDLISLGNKGFSLRKIKNITEDADEDLRTRIEDQRKVDVLRNYTLKAIEQRYEKFYAHLTSKLKSRENHLVLHESLVKSLVEGFCGCEQVGIAKSQIDRARASLVSDRQYQIQEGKETRLLVEKDLKCENLK